MKYEKMIQSILKEVGGQENIENVYHCATRLHLQGMCLLRRNRI